MREKMTIVIQEDHITTYGQPDKIGGTCRTVSNAVLMWGIQRLTQELRKSDQFVRAHEAGRPIEPTDGVSIGGDLHRDFPELIPDPGYKASLIRQD